MKNNNWVDFEFEGKLNTEELKIENRMWKLKIDEVNIERRRGEH